MSNTVKSIKIKDTTGEYVEKQFGVNAENINCGEDTTLNQVIENNNIKFTDIDNNMKSLNYKVGQIPAISLFSDGFDVGVITSDSPMIFPGSEIGEPIPTWTEVQKGFYKSIGKTNVFTENQTMPTDRDLSEDIPIVGGSEVKYDNNYDVISMKFLRKNFYYTDGEEPSLSKYSKQITLIPADSTEEPPIVPGNIISNKTYTVVENNKIYQLDANTEMILTEAKTLKNSAKIGDSINIIIYAEDVFMPPEPSRITPVFKFIEKTNMTEFDSRQIPDNKTICNAQSLWKQNQFLMKCIEDLYKQIDELKSNSGE